MPSMAKMIQRANANACGDLILEHTIDVAFVGIGENGHLAFNDPPADFDTQSPYIIVNLDAACKRSSWVRDGLLRSTTCPHKPSRCPSNTF